MGKYNGKIFHDVIEVLCEIRGITVDDFLEQVGNGMNRHKYDEYGKGVEPTDVDTIDVIAKYFGLSTDDLFSDKFLDKKREELAKIKITPVTQYDVAQIRGEIEKLRWYVDSIAKEIHDYKEAHISITDCEAVWDKS